MNTVLRLFSLVSLLYAPAACAAPYVSDYTRPDTPAPDERKPAGKGGDAGIVAALPDVAPRTSSSSDAGSRSATVLTVDSVGMHWQSIDGATFTQDGGLQIQAFTTSHAIVVPAPQPSLGSDDYTVAASVWAPADAEFGVLVRVQSDAKGAVGVGSKWGSDHRAFIGSFRSPDWNPTEDDRGPPYTFSGGRYLFVIQVRNAVVQAKMWRADETEPETFQLQTTSPWATGRGVGYYTYGVTSAVLERLVVSVP
jgi:hypothetical protein